MSNYRLRIITPAVDPFSGTPDVGSLIQIIALDEKLGEWRGASPKEARIVARLLAFQWPDQFEIVSEPEA